MDLEIERGVGVSRPSFLIPSLIFSSASCGNRFSHKTCMKRKEFLSVQERKKSVILPFNEYFFKSVLAGL